MARPNVRRSFSRSSSKRQSLWIGFTPTQTTITAGSGATLTHVLNAAALALEPFTVVRVRGEAYVHSDQIANTEHQSVGWAMAVVSQQASTIGITAVPTPFTDISSDLFFAYQPLINSFDVASSIGIMQTGTRYQIDSRAMRKVDEGSDVISVLETSGVSQGVIVDLWFRILVKLH